MKTTKILAIALFSFFVQFTFGQDKKEVKAKEKVTALNEKIIANNKEAALTEDQKEKLTALYVEQFNELDAIKKETSDPELLQQKNKEVYKKYSEKMNKEVLTEAQRKAKNVKP
jgi:hypothetical protein